MRIFFIGCVHFSRIMLDTILKIPGTEVVGIATKSKSKFNADHSDLSDLAISNNISWNYVKDINDEHIVNWISDLKPDIIFCFGWSSLIKLPLLKLPPMGVIGYHPAKLPQNRGRHPIIWALALGLSESASTFIKLDEGADSGDILSQNMIKISDEDDAYSIYEKLINEAKNQVLEFLPLLTNGNVIWKKQNHELANIWRKRYSKDGEIDFRMNSGTIFNLVRALTRPYVGAHILHNGNEIKVWKTKIGKSAPQNDEPGKVLSIGENGEICVKTSDSSIWLVVHEFKVLPIANEYIQ